MKFNKLSLLFLCMLISAPSFAKREDREVKDKFEHRIIAGFNMGATAPIPIPRTVRRISGYWPQFTPQLGYAFTYNYDDKWALETGLMLDYKGMGVRDRVKYMYTEVIMDGAEAKGYFVGRNETKVKTAYFTVPVAISFQVAKNWKIKAGGYFSYKTSSEFSGTVWDGYLRKIPKDEVPNENSIANSELVIIEDKDAATFDFGKDMRKYDFGVVAGMEHQFNQKFGIYADLTYGVTSIFPSSFKGIDMKMHNMYLAVGMSYRLK